MRIMLPIGATSLAAASALTLALLATSGGAFAASAVQKECSTKYQAAKSGGTLNGMSYNQYYKQCAAEAKAEKTAPAAPAAAAPAPTPTAAPVAPAAPVPTTTAKAPVAPAPVAQTPVARAPAAASTSGAVLPTAIAPSFASQTPHLGRLHTCAEQWKVNKAANANGNLKWPAFYSECNTRLKG